MERRSALMLRLADPLQDAELECSILHIRPMLSGIVSKEDLVARIGDERLWFKIP